MADYDLVVLRHGRPEPFGPGGRDEERPLTGPGAASFAQAARGLGRVLTSPVEIITSPYLRARQTADLLHQALAQEEMVVSLSGTWDALVPHGDPDRVQEMLMERLAEGTAGTLVLVSHMPLAGDLVGQLALGGRSLTLLPGEACAIRIGTGGTGLTWKLPERLAALLWDD